MTLELTIPGLPGYNDKRQRVLSPNSRCHWVERQRVVRTDSTNTIAAVLAHGRPPKPIERADVEISIHFRTRTRRDPDNMAPLVKGVLDGLVHAGVLIDDSTRNVNLTVNEGSPAPYEHYTLRVVERC